MKLISHRRTQTTKYGFVDKASLVPRSFAYNSLPIVKRDGSCGKDHHNCLDTGYGDQCCDNESYCYVNSSGESRCCPLGSNCIADSECNSEAYYCVRTITPTATTPQQATSTLASKSSIQTQAGCCGRRCPMPGYYLCPPDLGGNCCPYEAECRPGGKCVSVVVRTSSVKPIITPADAVCTTSQYKCADGTGCCNDWQSCTNVDNVAYCANTLPASSNLPEVHDGPTSKGLSDGAKAGVGVTVVAGIGLIAGVAVWIWVILKRRRATDEQPVLPAEVGDDTGSTNRETRHAPRREQSVEFFGHAAMSVTDTHTTNQSPDNDHAVPCQPEPPGDITTPVEIDSAVSPPEEANFGLANIAELADGPFELDGSPVEPHPWEETYFWSSDDSVDD